jgi:hypothetical protein
MIHSDTVRPLPPQVRATYANSRLNTALAMAIWV